MIYEANAYEGGHTDTHNIVLDEQNYAVDTGFIVFNEHNYHYFCQFLSDLNVASQPSVMSFSVTDAVTGLEYNAITMDKLFCQRGNLLRPRFYLMVLDILRFTGRRQPC
jgi:predicted NAD/FAD-binding protein